MHQHVEKLDLIMSVWLIVAPVQLLLHDLQPPPPPRVSAVVAVAVDG